jgi:hypothetical protein
MAREERVTVSPPESISNYQDTYRSCSQTVGSSVDGSGGDIFNPNICSLLVFGIPISALCWWHGAAYAMVLKTSSPGVCFQKRQMDGR